MNQKSLALYSVLFISTFALQACKMSDDQKLVLGMGALGALNTLSTDSKNADEENEQSNISAEETLKKQDEEKVKGNFGYELAQVFNTSGCLKGTLKDYACQVPLNGNTFFEKAFVGYHPQSKKIHTIIGKANVTEITVPQELEDAGITYAQKREYVEAMFVAHMLEQRQIVGSGLIQAGVLRENKNFDYEDALESRFVDGERKRLVFGLDVLKSNMNEYWVDKPSMTTQTTLSYVDKEIKAQAVNYLQEQGSKQQLEKLKGNF